MNREKNEAKNATPKAPPFRTGIIYLTSFSCQKSTSFLATTRTRILRSPAIGEATQRGHSPGSTGQYATSTL